MSNTFTKLLLLPIIAAGLILSSCSISSIGQKEQAKIASYSKQILEQAGTSISLKAEIVTNQLLDVALSEPVQKSVNIKDDYDKLINSRNISDLLTNTFIDSNDIAGVFVELNQGDLYSFYPSGMLDYEEVKKSVNLGNNGSTRWTAIEIKEKSYVVLCKTISTISNGNKIGEIHIVLKDSFFKDIIKSISYGENSSVFILDSDNIIITSTNPQIESAQKYGNTELIEELINSRLHTGMFDIPIDKVDNLVLYAKIDGLDWYLIGIVPTE